MFWGNVLNSDRKSLVDSPDPSMKVQSFLPLLQIATWKPVLSITSGFGIPGRRIRNFVTVGTSTSVSIVNRLRSAVSGTVTLTRPTANFRLTGSPAVSYVPGMSEPVSLDFAEVVA